MLIYHFFFSAPASKSFNGWQWCICLFEGRQPWWFYYFLSFLSSTPSGSLYSLSLKWNSNRKIRFAYIRIFQVNLIGHPSGLGFQETRDLWIQADTDANGVLDYEEFKVTSQSIAFGIWFRMVSSFILHKLSPDVIVTGIAEYDLELYRVRPKGKPHWE